MGATLKTDTNMETVTNTWYGTDHPPKNTTRYTIEHRPVHSTPQCKVTAYRERLEKKKSQSINS